MVKELRLISGHKNNIFRFYSQAEVRISASVLFNFSQKTDELILCDKQSLLVILASYQHSAATQLLQV